MMISKVRSAALAVVAVMVASAVIAPTASAQTTTLDLTVSAPSGALIPEAQIGKLSVVADYRGTNQLQVAGSFSSNSITITFNPVCPSSVVVVGPKTKVMGLEPTSGSLEGTVTAEFQVTVTRDAPGLKSIQCTVTGSAPALQDPAVPKPEDTQQTFTILGDYYSLVQAKVATRIKQAGPQKEVDFPIELTNFGNARTQISFEVGSRPEGERWNAVLPDNIILDSPNTGGEGKTSDTAIFTVSTPYKNGWNNEQGAFQVVMKVTSADVPDKQGNPVSANVLVRVRGVYVPGFEPVAMLGVVISAALVARMRRDEE